MRDLQIEDMEVGGSIHGFVFKSDIFDFIIEPVLSSRIWTRQN